jgi:hypothetical protein
MDLLFQEFALLARLKWAHSRSSFLDLTLQNSRHTNEQLTTPACIVLSCSASVQERSSTSQFANATSLTFDFQQVHDQPILSLDSDGSCISWNSTDPRWGGHTHTNIPGPQMGRGGRGCCCELIPVAIGPWTAWTLPALWELHSMTSTWRYAVYVRLWADIVHGTALTWRVVSTN